MSVLSCRRWALEEMFRSLSRSFSRSVLSLLLCALALSIPIFITIVLQGIAAPLKGLPASVELTVFMKKNGTVATLESEIRSMPWVSDVRYLDRADALREMETRLGLPVGKDAVSLLPDILIVTLAPNAGTVDIAGTARTIETMPSVDFVPYEASWHEKLRAISRAVWTGLACLGAVTALLVLLVLETAMRITTFTARTEMCTLYLLGASPAFAIRPHAWRGFVLMGLAALTALGITRLGLGLLQPAVSAAASLYEGSLELALPPSSVCAGIVIGAAITGSLIAALAALSTWHEARRSVLR